MKLHRLVFPSAAVAASLFAAGLACSGAQATPAADAQAQYRRELAACNSGGSVQGRSTCLREAQAAYAQNRRGDLGDRGANYANNASQRCAALEGSDRSACVTRMQGGGTTSGSVAGGGISRELVTITPGVPAPAEPASAASR
jgi:hypothetical protein